MDFLVNFVMGDKIHLDYCIDIKCTLKHVCHAFFSKLFVIINVRFFVQTKLNLVSFDLLNDHSSIGIFGIMSASIWSLLSSNRPLTRSVWPKRFKFFSGSKLQLLKLFWFTYWNICCSASNEQVVHKQLGGWPHSHWTGCGLCPLISKGEEWALCGHSVNI